MYLSSLLVNTGDNPDRPRPGRLWLRNRYRVHQRLCMAFPSQERKERDPLFLEPYRPRHFGVGDVHIERDIESGFLYRVDPVPAAGAVILVQSARVPDWHYAFQNADYLLAAPPEVRTLIPSWRDGDVLRFRLQANATRKVDTKSSEDRKRRHGRRVPLPREKLVDWLERKATRAGFELLSVSRVDTGYVYFEKDKPQQDGAFEKGKPQRGRLFSVVYDGVLRVTDSQSFGSALASGLGPQKAFGFGLLTVVATKE